MRPIRLVLASSSPRRRELLASLGVAFDVQTPDVDEVPLPDEPPQDTVLRLAKQKAEAIAARLAAEELPVYVLAADTTVILDGIMLGKPANEDEARTMLLALRGRTHQVCSGVALLREQPAATDDWSLVVCSDVTMRHYAASEMERYIATGDPFDKAGGYAIQHVAFNPVEAVQGSYTNVVGLPLDEVRALLEAAGFPLPPTPPLA